MTSGIHHITLITRNVQANVDYYAGFLGLRIVKRTGGFEDAGQLHLIYGDALGSPGSLVTFLVWENGSPGRVGHGQPTSAMGSILFSNGSRGGGSVVSAIDAFGCLRSLRAHGHLMGSAGYGAAWLKSQSAIRSTACYRIGAVIHSLPRASLPLGSSFRSPVLSGSLPIGYAGLNSVPCRSMACMMIASRRARAIRAFRIVDRAAIASAQSFSFSGPL
jgi:catechol 2,3-dioxygenase-like lactoylglutathione lyase family enzyme